MRRGFLFVCLLLFAAGAHAGAWPADDLSVTHLDSPTDDPSQARAQLLAGVNKVKAIIAARGDLNGVAALDGSGKVPIGQIPTGSGGVQAYDTDLAALAGMSSNGLLARTGTGSMSARTITAGTGVTVSNGNGGSGNPTIAASANLQAYHGKPAPTGAVVGTTDSQTLTNKTISGGSITGAGIGLPTPSFGTFTNVIVNGQLSHNKGCAPGYSRQSPGVCLSNESSQIDLTVNTCTALPAPIVMSAYILETYVAARSQNSAGGARESFISFYTSPSCSGSPYAVATARAYEFSAVSSNTEIGVTNTVNIIPQTRRYVRLTGTANAFGFLRILGYLDNN